MERPNIQEERPEVIAYIEYLENRVDGASKLSKEISLLKAGVAHDLELIRNGEEGDEYEHLKYVCLDKLSPRYNLVKVLMLNVKSLEDDAPIKPVGRPTKDKDVKEADELETIAIAGEIEGPAKNAFEEMSRRIVMNSIDGTNGRHN